jgi:DNA-binding transcriptional MerR regulator
LFRTNNEYTQFNIAAVERDTGLSKDVLRMWERRYGFPVPERDANGERLYPADQVERLRLIKRLMDQGIARAS